MKIFYFCFYIAAAYYTLFKLPRKIEGNKFVWNSIVISLLMISLFFGIVQRTNTDFKINHIAAIILSSIQFVLLLIVANRLSTFLVDLQVSFHTKYNSSNIYKTPVRQIIQYHAQFKKAFTWFWFISAAIIIRGIIFVIK